MRTDRDEEWQLWLEMARESLLVARSAEDTGSLRSSLSRCYYAAYQAATAVLIYRKQKPPELRNAWSHAETPTMFREHTKPVIGSEDKRKDLADRLQLLYKLRIQADYTPSISFEATKVQRARRDASYILKVAQDLLPRE